MSSWAVSLFETAVYIEGHPMGVKNGNHKAIHKTSRPMWGISDSSQIINSQWLKNIDE